MPKVVNLFQCEYCDHSLKTEAGITSHEKTCSHNPEVIHNKKVKKGANKQLEHIRLNATSIPDLMERITNFLDTIGISIHFDSYPSGFTTLASNSHGSPKGYPKNWSRTEGSPKGYPGWTGTFRGNVEYKNSSKCCSFWDALGDTFDDSEYHIWFFDLGSGSGGNSFSQSGTFWLYDFPKMHEEWKQKGNEHKQLTAEYASTLAAIHIKRDKAEKAHVDSAQEVTSINSAITKCKKLLEDLRTTHDASRKFHLSEYRRVNILEIPELPSAFVNLSDYQRVLNQKSVDICEQPSTTAIYTRLKTLSKEAVDYKANHPEYFI